jgi:hypothetical protein
MECRSFGKDWVVRGNAGIRKVVFSNDADGADDGGAVSARLGDDTVARAGTNALPGRPGRAGDGSQEAARGESVTGTGARILREAGARPR